mmetsp:Transcript_33311/g.96521  ORF Transcript_33311/g.96521 Transcript_33311/m.96521 type:complete len:362 (-) Transcript_33311:106-1191(-)
MSRNLNIAKGSVDTAITRSDTGIHTVEGNVAGSRAARMTKYREQQQAEYEMKKKKIQEDSAKGARNIDDRFNTSRLEFNTSVSGLMTKEEYTRLMDGGAAAAAAEDGPAEVSAEEKARLRKLKKEKKKQKKRALAALSFGDEEVEEEASGGQEGGGADSGGVGGGVVKKRMKNPNVATDFLPDREREEAEQRERERLKTEWLEEQEKIKKDSLEVTYSYWDGSGHRRVITITKGTTVGKFLEAVRHGISSDFHELRTVSSENLLYVKEDLIIPHNYTFYDLIVTKARGKSGPLFHFDVHDDVRLSNDARIEKDESHPGKIVERHWYERNKHIFPASRWEVYDPSVKRGDYTIHGGEVNAKE